MNLGRVKGPWNSFCRQGSPFEQQLSWLDTGSHQIHVHCVRMVPEPVFLLSGVLPQDLLSGRTAWCERKISKINWSRSQSVCTHSSNRNDFHAGVSRTFQRWHFGMYLVTWAGGGGVNRLSVISVIFLRDNCFRKFAAKLLRTIFDVRNSSMASGIFALVALFFRHGNVAWLMHSGLMLLRTSRRIQLLIGFAFFVFSAVTSFVLLNKSLGQDFDRFKFVSRDGGGDFLSNLVSFPVTALGVPLHGVFGLVKRLPSRQYADRWK